MKYSTLYRWRVNDIPMTWNGVLMVSVAAIRWWCTSWCSVSVWWLSWRSKTTFLWWEMTMMFWPWFDLDLQVIWDVCTLMRYYDMLTSGICEMFHALRPLLSCVWQVKWAERPTELMRRRNRWNTLLTCPRRDLNSDDWDVWPCALSDGPRRRSVGRYADDELIPWWC